MTPPKTEVLNMRIEPELLARINEQRRLEEDPPPKAEMVRTLLIEALDAREAKARKKGGKG